MLYPKIGIRPVIDGRWGGVRESLENQGFWMWKTSGVIFHSFHIGTEQKSFEHL